MTANNRTEATYERHPRTLNKTINTYVEYTRRWREENITFSQNLNAFEASEIHCLGNVFLFSVRFHFLIWLKRKNSEMNTQSVLIIFLGCLSPKEGNPGVLALDHKLPE